MGRDPVGFVDGFSLYKAYFAILGVDPQGTKFFLRDAGFRDASVQNGFCGDPYFWEQGVDLNWSGMLDEGTVYSNLRVYGVNVRTGALIQHVRHEFVCASCDCPPIETSAVYEYWEWFGLEQDPARPLQPWWLHVGRLGYRLYGRDFHWINFAPPIADGPQLTCLSSVRVTTFLGTTVAIDGWWGPLAHPVPPNPPPGSMPRGAGRPTAEGHEWGFDVMCVLGRCHRISKFGF